MGTGVMRFFQLTQDTSDVIKVGTAVSAPTLSLFGVPVEQWTFILSGIVSILFIIEKSPVLLIRIKALIQWIKNLRKK